jgi:eukaryotic-like serine/threonine-protein kinase
LSRDPEVPQHLPAPWPPLLAAMTALNPDDRPNATQVADTLRGRQGAAVAAPILLDPAAADATPTVGLAALGASAVPPPAEPWSDELSADEPPPSRRTGWLLAAAAVVAALAVTAFLLVRPTSGSRGPVDSGPGPATHHPSGTHSRGSSSRQVAPVNDISGKSSSGSGASTAAGGRKSNPAPPGTAAGTGRNSAPNTGSASATDTPSSPPPDSAPPSTSPGATGAPSTSPAPAP